MPEIDIERKVEKYWGRKDRQLNIGDEEEFQQMLHEIEERFIDPTSDKTVRAVDFARCLNPKPLLDVLKTSYPYFEVYQTTF